MTAATATTTQVFRVYIKADAQKVWDAIVDPAWNARYGYPGRIEYDLRPCGAVTGPATDEMKAMGLPDVIVDGEVVEVDEPRKLVQTWRFKFAPEQVEEGFRTVTWLIEDEFPGVCRLTVTHDVTDAPLAAGTIGLHDGKLDEGAGGWTFILQDLKSLLETGSSLRGG